MVTEIDCILRQLKSIMKQQQVQKGVKTPRRVNPTVNNNKSVLSLELLHKLHATTNRIKIYAQDFLQQIIRPFYFSSRQLANVLRVDKHEINLFKDNICEKHMIFALIQSVDFIHQTVQ